MTSDQFHSLAMLMPIIHTNTQRNLTIVDLQKTKRGMTLIAQAKDVQSKRLSTITLSNYPDYEVNG